MLKPCCNTGIGWTAEPWKDRPVNSWNRWKLAGTLPTLQSKDLKNPGYGDMVEQHQIGQNCAANSTEPPKTLLAASETSRNGTRIWGPQSCPDARSEVNPIWVHDQTVYYPLTKARSHCYSMLTWSKSVVQSSNALLLRCMVRCLLSVSSDRWKLGNYVGLRKQNKKGTNSLTATSVALNTFTGDLLGQLCCSACGISLKRMEALHQK